MTFQRPSELPKFADQDIDNDVDGAPNKLAPSDDVKNKGLAFLQSAGRRGSTQVINWYNGLVYKWLGYLDEQVIANANTATSNETTNSSHRGSTSNPHSVTKAQVGLGNVDNTSDADKPVSTAQQNAINAKANKTDTMEKLFDFQEETDNNYSTWGIKTLPDVATGNAREVGSYLFVFGSNKLSPVICTLNINKPATGSWRQNLEVISGDTTYLKIYGKVHTNLSGRDILDYKILFEFPDNSWYEGAYSQMYHLAGEKGEFFGGDEAFEELQVGSGYIQGSHNKKFETTCAGYVNSNGSQGTIFGRDFSVTYDTSETKYVIESDVDVSSERDFISFATIRSTSRNATRNGQLSIYQSVNSNGKAVIEVTIYNSANQKVQEAFMFEIKSN